MAGLDNTEIFKNGVQLINPAAATAATETKFNAGDTIEFSIETGDIITSTRPIQVDMITGDIGDNFEMRWFAQVDRNDWSDEYISPVAETAGSTGFWFYK